MTTADKAAFENVTVAITSKAFTASDAVQAIGFHLQPEVSYTNITATVKAALNNTGSLYAW